MDNKFYFVVSKLPPKVEDIIFSDEFYNPNKILNQLGTKEWSRQEWGWTVQTFYHLSQKGFDVELVTRPVSGAICITHYETTKNLTKNNTTWGADSFIVGIRSDTPPMRVREIQVSQSPALVNDKNSFFICYWPQAELIPRNLQRENKIETLSYFGGPGGLSPVFKDELFKKKLSVLGVALNICYEPKGWNDYSQTDLVIGVRNHHHPLLIKTKPSSKLVNTWQAGCVALLGKEPAFQAVGKVGEDYFEVDTPEDVLRIVQYLKNNPEIYQNMRDLGREKYKEYSFEAIQEQWIKLLTGPVSEAFDLWKTRRDGYHRFLHRSRRYVQSAHQWVDHKLFYIPVRAKSFISDLTNNS